MARDRDERGRFETGNREWETEERDNRSRFQEREGDRRAREGSMRYRGSYGDEGAVRGYGRRFDDEDRPRSEYAPHFRSGRSGRGGYQDENPYQSGRGRGREADRYNR